MVSFCFTFLNTEKLYLWAHKRYNMVRLLIASNSSNIMEQMLIKKYAVFMKYNIFSIIFVIYF